MRYTLLEMVQELLSSMDSDSVGSITDTEEAYQVALLLRGVFYDLAVELRLPEHDGLFEIDASGDGNIPCMMTLPSETTRLDSIKYNTQADADTYTKYELVQFVPFYTFQEMQQALREQASNVGTQNFTQTNAGSSETFEMLYWTNKDPQWYTTMDDYTLLFDSYDSTKDTTLQKSKTMCYGSQYTTFTLTDAFAPDLDPTQFAYFRNRAKVRAFAELKQTANREATFEAINQKRVLQQNKRRVEDQAEVYQVARFGRAGGGNWTRDIPRKLRNGT